MTDTVPEMTPEQAQALELTLRGALAREAFDFDHYEHFHWCVFQHDLQPHEVATLQAYFEEWRKPASSGARGVLNKAARGLFKSTDSAGFLLFVIGHYPHLSHMVVQARDEDAQKTGKLLADTISSSAGWKACFPHVAPDTERGWSQNGYNVKRTDMPYDKWVQLVVSDHKRDPSIMSVSVQAGGIGMHPTGILLLDDIHDTKNTESLAEMARVIKTILADFMPTMNRPGRKPLMIVAYTPWKSDDAYAVLEKSGIFRQLVTPAYVVVSEEATRLINLPDRHYAEFDGQHVRLTCPEVYSATGLDQQLRLLGRREFSRQLLCTLDVGKGQALPYYPYILTGNEFDLPVVGGADPTAVEPDRLNDGKMRSYFALAYVAKLPQGGAVVLDGVLEQCSHYDAENHIFSAQNRFPRWAYTMVENVGPGAAFLQNARRNPRLRLIESSLVSIDEKGRQSVKSKDERILQMAKWFEDGTIKIAAKDTPFLNALRYLFDHFWEMNKNTPHMAWDAGDATYHALKGLPEILQAPIIPLELPRHGAPRRSGLGSVWNSLGRS